MNSNYTNDRLKGFSSFSSPRSDGISQITKKRGLWRVMTDYTLKSDGVQRFNSFSSLRSRFFANLYLILHVFQSLRCEYNISIQLNL